MKISLLKGKKLVLLVLIMLLVVGSWYAYSNKQRFHTPERADLVYNHLVEVDGVMF